MSTRDLLGRSLGFPPRVDATGRMLWSEGEHNVRESIRIILSTNPKERIMLPAFGAGLDQFLFEPNTPASLHKIEQRIRTALTQWEPRVDIQSIVVETDPSDATSVVATIAYTLVATRAQERMTLAISVGR